MSGPLVSVIIPTFNREAVVGLAIESALKQTYAPLEIIVVDDGSRDGTRGLLASFGARIRVIHQENAGPSAARNRGLASAQGEYLAYLDSDDLWLPTKVAEQVDLLERLGPEVPCCLCNIHLPHSPAGRDTSFAVADLRASDRQGVWLNPTEILMSRFILFNQAVVVRKWAMDKAGLFNIHLRLLEDYDLAVRLSTLGPWAYISTPLVQYGTSQDNSLSRWGESEPGRIHGVMRKILLEVRQSGRIAEKRALRLLDGQVRCCNLICRAAETLRQRRPLSSQIAWVLRGMVKVRNSLFRRSPFWPRMRTLSVEEYCQSRVVLPPATVPVGLGARSSASGPSST